MAAVVIFGLASLYPKPYFKIGSSISQQDQTAKGLLQELQKELSTNAPIAKSKSVDWVDDNKQAVPLAGWTFGVGISANSYMGHYGNFSNISEITEASLQPLQSTAENFFVKNGFTVSDLNKKTNELSETTYGYSLGDLKCLTKLSPQSNAFARFFCGTLDVQELAWRKELVMVINSENNQGIRVTVDKEVNNMYATGFVGVSSGGTGATWYAVKVDGQWKEVWTGQNIISCKPVQQYNIPKEIYGNECSSNY